MSDANPNSIGGGGGANPIFDLFFLKCPFYHKNNTALIKQISLFDTAYSHDKYLKFQFKLEKNIFFDQ